jgi:hypothetical protein
MTGGCGRESLLQLEFCAFRRIRKCRSRSRRKNGEFWSYGKNGIKRGVTVHVLPLYLPLVLPVCGFRHSKECLHTDAFMA